MARILTERDTCAFDFLTIPEARPKPRNSRWTILSDRGLLLQHQRDILELNGDLVDYVKFVDFTGLIRRFPVRMLRKKISIYKKRRFPTFPGGIAFEIACLQNQVERYFERVRELGFDGVEVSTDSMPELPRGKRSALIRRAKDMGLDVFTEVGKKFFDSPFPIKEAIECIKGDLDAGALKVTLENSELVYYCQRGDPKPVHRIIRAVGVEPLVFEVGRNGWPELSVWLLEHFGPEINIENIEADRIVIFEGMRRGLQRIVGYHFVISLQQPGRGEKKAAGPAVSRLSA